MKNKQALLTAEQLTISHASKTQAVIDGVDFNIQQGEIITILGPSGVGKSTLLSTLAGLHVPEKGQVELLGKPIAQQKSEMALMFQSAVLLPWLDIAENVAGKPDFRISYDGRMMLSTTDSSSKNLNIRVFDTTGKVILTETWITESTVSEKQLNFSKKGVFIVQVSGSGLHLTTKWIQ